MDYFRDEGDYEDIQDYSQSNIVMPNLVRYLFGVEEDKKVEEEEKIAKKEELKKKSEDVKGK